MFTKYVNGEQIPQEWKTGWIFSVYKKVDQQKCKNYSGITVTSTVNRLFGRIIRDKIEEEYKRNEAEQWGSQPQII